MWRKWIEKARIDHKLEEKEIAALLASDGAEEPLAIAADSVRKHYVGDGVYLRGLIEFSNICRRSCLYCGLRRENEKIERYRLTAQEILQLAKKAKSYGYRTVVLQGGEDSFWSVERLEPILQQIRALGLVITLSIGERSYEEYRALKKAGASRFLLRIETTDQKLYERLDPGMSFAARRKCLYHLRALGYEVGTGSLVGLPGQSLSSLAKDILFFQALDADMVGIGPFIPNGDTPLAKALPGDIHLTRRMVSLLRLLLPEANIPATTAMQTLERSARSLILRSGANVVMANVTPGDARRKYALYPGKASVCDTPKMCRSALQEELLEIGRFFSKGEGSRKKDRLAEKSSDEKETRCKIKEV